MPRLRTPLNGTQAITPDVIVQWDCNENVPLKFPGTIQCGDCTLRVGVRRVALIATDARRPVPTGVPRIKGWGDYCFEGYERESTVDTKRGLRELEGNAFGTSQEVRRYYRALDAMAGNVKHPYICLDMRVEEVFLPKVIRERMGIRRTPDQLLDRLATDCAERGISILGPWSSTRTSPSTAGALVLRFALLPWAKLKGKRSLLGA